jgi:hypothetical protein
MIKQLVQLLAGSDNGGRQEFPHKMVVQSLLNFIERILTLDTKDSNVKPLFKIIDKVFEQFVSLKLLH